MKIQKGFTLFELLLILFILSILVSIVTPYFRQTYSLEQAITQIIMHINHTRFQAQIDYKYQYYPKNNTNKEINTTKFWFKQWWQIRFTNVEDNIFYVVFSDQATNYKTTTFNGRQSASQDYEIALDPLTHEYMVGNDASSSSEYPEQTLYTMNLTKTYGIDRIELSDNYYSSSSMPNNLGKRLRMLFDSSGQIYFREGDTGADSNDIYPYDPQERKSLTKNLIIKFYRSTDFACIRVYPKTGYLEYSKCF